MSTELTRTYVSELKSKFNKIDLIEFLIIFRRWLKVVFTTWKNRSSSHGSLRTWFLVSLITPDVTFGGGKKEPGLTEKSDSVL